MSFANLLRIKRKLRNFRKTASDFAFQEQMP